MPRNVVLLDNFDSFTFNLVEAFERGGAHVRVLRNTAPASQVADLAAELGAVLVLSPGPGTPRDAGCLLELVALARGKLPVIGVCLGHQAIVEEAGGRVTRAPQPVHGKPWAVRHNRTGAFEGLPERLTVGRYHSLTTVDVPSRFTVDAVSDGDDLVMAISDAEAQQTGLQFHPESILTPRGDRIVANLLRLAGRRSEGN
jgi:anthranilate synthase/aminodeoxychorismate synthase-like glutamine amidotransferase